MVMVSREYRDFKIFIKLFYLHYELFTYTLGVSPLRETRGDCSRCTRMFAAIARQSQAVCFDSCDGLAKSRMGFRL